MPTVAPAPLPTTGPVPGGTPLQTSGPTPGTAPMPQPPGPTGPNQSQQQSEPLSPTLVAFTRAWRNTETGGQQDPYNVQGGSGEWGAYQFTKPLWDSIAPKYGVSSAFGQATPTEQNKVAYNYAKSLADQGYKADQMASIINSGKPDYKGNVGINKYGVKYNTPQYVDSLIKTFNSYKQGNYKAPITPTSSTVGNEQNASTEEIANQQNAQQTGATFAANPLGNPLGEAAKAVGNIPSSIFGTVKGLGQMIQHPIQTGENIIQHPYQSLVPEGARNVISGVGDLLTGKNASTDFANAERNVVNNPFGTIAPFVGGAEVGAGLMEGTANLGDLAENAKINDLTPEETAMAKDMMIRSGEAGKVAQAGQSIKEGINTIGETVNPFKQASKASGAILAKGGEMASNQLEKDWNTALTATKRGVQQTDENLALGKDTAKLLAQKGITPEADGTKYDTTNATAQIEKDLNGGDGKMGLNKVYDAVLKSNPRQFNIEDLRQKMLDSVDTPQARAENLVPKMEKVVNDEIDGYKQTYGENVDLSSINEMKKGQARLSKVFDMTQPNFAKNAHYIMSRVAKDFVIDNTDSVNMKALGKYIGEHYEALDQLDRVNGQTIKGGRLGKYVGTAVGATLGHGIVGKLLGAAGGNYVIQALNNLAVTNPLRNFLLQYAESSDPQVYSQAIDYLNKLKNEPTPLQLGPGPVFGNPPPFKPTSPEGLAAERFLNELRIRQQQDINTRKLGPGNNAINLPRVAPRSILGRP